VTEESLNIIAAENSDSASSDDSAQRVNFALDETVSEETAPSSSLIELSSRKGEMSIPDIVKKVKPSVVGISAEFSDSTVSTGTGIIISEDGYIVTNAHVVQNTEGGASERSFEVTAVLYDDSSCSAVIIGADSRTDLAVLKINADGETLTPAEFGDSDELCEGELAIAIGNPLGFELYGSVTSGIISALNRTVTVGEYEMNLIQTDAAINPGNSGGPLINGSGQVIGINSSKIISDNAEGLGFAIPVSSAKPVIDDLIENGYVTGRPLIDISGEDISELTASYYKLPQGVCVRFITPDSAADKSGMEVGDIIIGLDGESVSTMEELNNSLKKFAAGDTVSITVYRQSTETQFEISLLLDESIS
jgi:serine protease Do